jgi:hypothetical protein
MIVPRRVRHKQDPLSQILDKVKQRLGASPLSVIYPKFEEVVLTLQQDLQHGLVGQNVADWLSGSIIRMLDLLPQSFGERFYFDTGMITALSEEWSQGSTRLSGTIYPKPGKDWRHVSLPLPNYGRAAMPVIDLVLIPGDDRLEDVDLLAYPLLCHELGHNALFKHDTAFPQSFRPALEQVTNGLLRQSLADQGAARVRARNMVTTVRQLWNPTANHYNWAHEIAVDVIALWTTGPAYLATFQDTLENEAPNPYQVGQSHPPYEVRANALIDASGRLGWEDYTHGLSERVAYWRQSHWREERNNRYVACASADLVRGCVTSAISVCEVLSLPKCSGETLKAVREKLDQGETPDWGSEVLIAAWLQCRQMDKDSFSAWESKAVRELAQAVIPEIR